MANVNPVDGVKYGFRLMGYTIAVFVGGAIIAGVGVGMIDNAGMNTGSIAIGGLIALFGVAIIYAGLFGMAYKIIADAVEQGVRAATQGNQADGFRAGNGQRPAAGRANRQQSGGRGGRQQSGGGRRPTGDQRSSRQRSGSRQSGSQRSASQRTSSHQSGTRRSGSQQSSTGHQGSGQKSGQQRQNTTQTGRGSGQQRENASQQQRGTRESRQRESGQQQDDGDDGTRSDQSR